MERFYELLRQSRAFAETFAIVQNEGMTETGESNYTRIPSVCQSKKTIYVDVSVFSWKEALHVHQESLHTDVALHCDLILLAGQIFYLDSIVDMLSYFDRTNSCPVIIYRRHDRIQKFNGKFNESEIENVILSKWGGIVLWREIGNTDDLSKAAKRDLLTQIGISR